MEASHDPECRRVLKTTINSLEYFYDGEHVTCFGHSFIKICLGDDNRNKPIQFWKAQLAFRGFSPRESDIEALKQRLVNSNTDGPDTVVEQGIQKMMRAYRKKDRENKEPVHQAQQARHEEEGKDSDQDSVKDNDEGEDHTEECDDEELDDELDDDELDDDELDDDELDDDELDSDELDDERVYLGIWATTGH